MGKWARSYGRYDLEYFHKSIFSQTFGKNWNVRQQSTLLPKTENFGNLRLAKHRLGIKLWLIQYEWYFITILFNFLHSSFDRVFWYLVANVAPHSEGRSVSRRAVWPLAQDYLLFPAATPKLQKWRIINAVFLIGLRLGPNFCKIMCFWVTQIFGMTWPRLARIIANREQKKNNKQIFFTKVCELTSIIHFRHKI